MTQKQIKLPLEELQVVFDIAVNSMDFGSGFLDNDEVAILRSIATRLGVDPNVGTPSNHQASYPHPYKPFKKDRFGNEPRCMDCFKDKEWDTHT